MKKYNFGATMVWRTDWVRKDEDENGKLRNRRKKRGYANTLLINYYFTLLIILLANKAKKTSQGLD